MTHSEIESGPNSYPWLPWLILGLLVLVNIFNVLRMGTLPFIDLPNHLAEAKIHSVLTADQADGDHPLRQQYVSRITPFRPNILHLMFCAASGHIEAGNRLYYLLYLILLPLAAGLLIRRIGGDPWFSLLSVALLYNFNVMWGFSGFTLAVPLCLLAVLAAQKLVDRPSLIRAAALAAMGLLLYYAHALAFLFFLPVYLMILIAGGRKTVRQIGWCLLPLVPAAAVFALWRFSSAEFRGYESMWSFFSDYYENDYWPTFIKHRLAGFLWNDFKWIAWQGGGRYLVLLLAVVAAGSTVYSLAARRFAGGRYGRPRRLLLWFTLLAIACFLVLPQGLPKQNFLFHRFSVFAYIGLIAGASLIPPGRIRRAVRIVAVGCSVLLTGLWFHYFSGFRAWSGGMSEVTRGLDNRKTLSAIIDDSSYRGMPSLIHYNNYHIIWNEGVAASTFTRYRFSVVRTRRNAARRLPLYHEFVRENTNLPSLALLYTRTDLLLIRGDRPLEAARASGRWTVLKSAGAWTVFEKKARPAAP